jgi:hypothetical protein
MATAFRQNMLIITALASHLKYSHGLNMGTRPSVAQKQHLFGLIQEIA